MKKLIATMFMLILSVQAYSECMLLMPRLYELCTSNKTYTANVEKGYCMGYIIGVYDRLQAEKETKNENNGICITPDTQTVGSIMDAVVDYIAANNQYQNYCADDIMLSALQDKFPCED